MLAVPGEAHAGVPRYIGSLSSQPSGLTAISLSGSVLLPATAEIQFTSLSCLIQSSPIIIPSRLYHVKGSVERRNYLSGLNNFQRLQHVKGSVEWWASLSTTSQAVT
jgi:hypothetical protein